MTAKRVARGEYTKTCPDCGWTGTHDTEAKSAYAYRSHSCDLARRRAEKAERHAARMAAVDRTPKVCQHKQADHQHGTVASYTLDGCRCWPCADARRAVDRERHRQKAYGRWDNLVDAGPARAHIQSLIDQGMSAKRIAAVSDVSHGMLSKLLWGTVRPDGERRPTKRVRKETAERILAIEVDLAPNHLVPAHGTRRRLQALIAIGYPQAELARRLGMLPSNFGVLLHHSPEVTHRRGQDVVALYDELSMTPARPETPAHQPGITRARRYARRMMWHSPLAWDDETIDDPLAGPAGVEEPVDVDEVVVQRILSGDVVPASLPEKRAVTREWLAAGRSLKQLEQLTGWRTDRYVDRTAA